MPLINDNETMCQTSNKPNIPKTPKTIFWIRFIDIHIPTIFFLSIRSARNPEKGGIIIRGAIAAKVTNPTIAEDSDISKTIHPRATISPQAAPWLNILQSHKNAKSLYLNESKYRVIRF